MLVEESLPLKDMTLEVIGDGTRNAKDVGFMLIDTLRKTIVNYAGLWLFMHLSLI